jgi:hypothetical protein
MIVLPTYYGATPKQEMLPMLSRFARSAALVSAVAVLSPVSIAHSQGSVDDRDVAEIKSYRLTMDVIRKVAAAGEAMAKAIEADPRYKAEKALKDEIEALEKKDELTEAEEKRLEDLRTKLEEQEEKAEKESGDDSDAQTLDGMAKRIERVPAMANAIRSAGLTPREYSKISLVMFQAMMVHGFQKAAANKELPKEFAGSVLAENIKFVADNEAEITRLLERMKMEKKGS